jgi:hypothetical protein
MKLLAALGAGFDCASKAELEAVAEMGVPKGEQCRQCEAVVDAVVDMCDETCRCSCTNRCPAIHEYIFLTMAGTAGS